MIPRTSWFLLALLLAATGSSAAEGPFESVGPSPTWRIRVAADGVRLRTAPDPGAPALGLLARGDVLEVVSWSPTTRGFANDQFESRALGFWIQAVDGGKRKGWVASFLVVPLGVWPEKPWLLGHVEPACDSNGSGVGSTRASYFEAFEYFEGGASHEFATQSEAVEESLRTPRDARRRKAREAVDQLLSGAKSVTRLGVDGSFERLDLEGWGHACHPCPDGPGNGPAFAGGPASGLATRLAAIGVDASVRTAESDSRRALTPRPFFRFRDGSDLRESLSSVFSFDPAAPDRIDQLSCTGPAQLAVGARRKAIEIWNCRFASGEASWSMLLGLHFPDRRASPFLLRISRFLDDGDGLPAMRSAPIDYSEWRIHSAQVETSTNPPLVSDLNGDGVLELWFESKARLFSGASVFAWEIYFLRDDGAFGPWFLVVDGGSGCE